MAERALSRRSGAASFAVVAVLALALLAPAPAFAIFPVDVTHDWNLRIDGGSLSENLGGSLANAGDVNGDGVDDMLVGAINASEVFVVYGQPGASRAVLDAGSITGVQGYLIKGPELSNTGFSVANAGDVNGDGVPDALIGAPVVGAEYVVFGQRTSSPVTISLANIGTPGNTQGYRILAGPDDSFVGSGSAGVGDVNDDGIPDALVGGMSSNHNGRMVSGSAWVVFGQRGSVGDVDLGTLSPAQGYRFDGASASDELGAPVAAAGDVNKDGIPDFLVAAQLRTFNGHFQSGVVYVLYGRRSASAPIDLNLLTPATGYEIGGAKPIQDVGADIEGDVDFDGDGAPDALVGASDTGQAYIVFGQPAGTATVDLAQIGTTGNRQGTLIDTPFDQSTFGIAVSAGDVNGDGIPDAIVGDSGATVPPGEGYVVFGQRPSPERISTAGIGVTPGDRAGFVLLNPDGGPTPANGLAMLNTGDLDHDGADDVAMAAPFNSPHPDPGLAAEGSVFTVLSALVLPGATTGPATDITPTSARLTGTVGTDAVTCSSAGTPTTSHFELGPTTAYGTETPPATAGLNVGDVAAEADATGLSAGTYHYRLVAECADGGRRFGADRTFDVPNPADLAAKLVADSTGKGPGKALASKARGIQTAVNAGRTATACAGITGYLALVKAHTGKKLTIAQATQLTTDATDLADALGC